MKTQAIMDYSFEICTAFDDVFLFDDNESAELVVYIPIIDRLLWHLSPKAVCYRCHHLIKELKGWFPVE